MTQPALSRRHFQRVLATGGLALGAQSLVAAADPAPATPAVPAAPAATTPLAADAPKPPTDSASVPYERDYPPPGYTPKFKRPQLARTLIHDFVLFAHYDLPMVQKLLARDASLVHTTVDWGAGDWESALGAAAHMGRRDIAEFLLSQGARIDIFAAAMLGYLDVVKSLLTSHPQLLNARGPHGFTLISHAKAGKEKSLAVLTYLEELKANTPAAAPATDKPAEEKPAPAATVPAVSS